MDNLSKRQTLKDINAIVDYSRKKIKFNRDEIESQERFIDCLFLLIQNEAPEFVEKMGKIKDQYIKLLSNEKLLIDAEERYADDLDDISARFEVIFRLGEELDAAKKKVRDLRNKIEKLRKDLEIDRIKGGQKSVKIEAELAKTEDAKKEAVGELDAKYVQVMDQRKKFTIFRTNRLQHAFQKYGSVLQSTMEDYAKEGEVFQNIISETHDQIDQLLDKPIKIPSNEVERLEPEIKKEDQ